MSSIFSVKVESLQIGIYELYLLQIKEMEENLMTWES